MSTSSDSSSSGQASPKRLWSDMLRGMGEDKFLEASGCMNWTRDSIMGAANFMGAAPCDDVAAAVAVFDDAEWPVAARSVIQRGEARTRATTPHGHGHLRAIMAYGHPAKCTGTQNTNPAC